MISRRLFAALPLAVPLAHGSLPRLDIEDIRHEPLDVGRTTVLSLSPDGTTLAGIQARNRLCFLNASTLEVLAIGTQMDELQLIDRASVHWSPDGTRIAFSLDAHRGMHDSDIFVADSASAAITNITAEGQADETAPLMDTNDVLIDLYPRWVDNAALLFARHDSSDGEVATCNLCTLAVESGVVETAVSLQSHDYRFVTSPPILRVDGSMIMTVQGGARASEIVIVDADGEVSPVAVESMQAPVVVSANETHVVVQDRAAFGSLLIPLDDPGTARPFGDIFGYGTGYQFIGQPAIASAPERYAAVAISDSSDKYRVFTIIDGKRRDRGYLGGEVSNPTCHLVGGFLLIEEARNAWLIDLDT